MAKTVHKIRPLDDVFENLGNHAYEWPWPAAGVMAG
jgi:hypothetical protein